MNSREAIPSSVKLGMMADRVIFEFYRMLCSDGPLKEIDLVALNRAAAFMENAREGRKVIQGLLIGGKPVEATSAFSYVLAALEAIYRSKSEKEKQSINQQGLDSFFKRYVNACHKVLQCAGTHSDVPGRHDIKLLLEFFKSLRKVTFASSVSAPEVVVLPT